MSIAEEQQERHEAGGIDRRRFLRMGGLSLAAAAALAACGSDNGDVGAGSDDGDAPEEPEEGKGSTSDVRFLNDATAAEQAAVAAYVKIIEALGDSDDDLRNTLNTMSGHHEEHFRVLAGATEALGGDTNRDEDADLNGLVERELAGASNPDAIRRVAYLVESALAQRYAQAAAGLDDKALHKTTLAVLGSEARHVAALGLLANDPGLPPFATSGLGLPQPAASTAPAPGAPQDA
ncbi:MAG: ferritin-like domain-containing protein [Acidimicrobiia bacterium]